MLTFEGQNKPKCLRYIHVPQKVNSNPLQSATHSMNGNCTLKYAFPHNTYISSTRQTAFLTWEDKVLLKSALFFLKAPDGAITRHDKHLKHKHSWLQGAHTHT
jgi:hypothetical protein